MSGKKVVVLGANAFSGQDFIDLLLDNPDHRVIGVSRSDERSPMFLRFRERADSGDYSFHRLDLNKNMGALLTLLDRERPQWIVNFAAQSEVGQSWDHPEHWFRTNTVAMARLVNHLRKQDYLERFLHISSPEAYGSCSGVVTEDTPDNPSTPYAASRAASDMLLDVYRREFGFPLLTVRSTNVFGARQQLFKIIPRTAIYLRLGRQVPLHGGGIAVKSYIHIRDVSRGELAILKAGRVGERYHLSPDASLSIREVVAITCRLAGRDFADWVEPVDERLGQDAAYVIDSTKARREFGWRPEITFEAGVTEVLDWVDTHLEAIKDQSLEYVHRA